MNWLSNLLPPRIRSFVGEQKEMPDNLWQKCPKCDGMLFHRDLADNWNVCTHCGHHLRLTVAERLKMMFDGGAYDKLEMSKVEQDPLKFRDRKRYADRIREAQQQTGFKDAITVARGKMDGLNVVVAAFHFSYMGGSMGAAVGEGIVKAAETAIRDKAALIVIPASGGARMQEGMISLMQMPRTIIAVEMVKDEKLPYIVILTDPTTGGVSASFAMVGDIHIAEPGAMIGFAGRRVIEETVRETLPEGFQTAEYLLAHGMVDMVVPRKDMKKQLSTLIGILMKKNGHTTTPDDSPPPEGQKYGPYQPASQAFRDRLSSGFVSVSNVRQIKGVRAALAQVQAARIAVGNIVERDLDYTKARKKRVSV
jgi:acetyl-CoA carboxylase carboxyl transferase subunit beta